MSDIQDYFEYISKKHGVNPSTKLYIDKIENRITFKIKTGYYFDFLLLKQWNYLEALKVR